MRQTARGGAIGFFDPHQSTDEDSTLIRVIELMPLVPASRPHRSSGRGSC